MTTAVDVVAHHSGPVPSLLAAALPAARAARRHGVHTHVERHWRHGPHLRVRVAGAPAAVAAAVDPLRAALAAHLADHPAGPADPSPAELLARSVVQGRAELEPGPYEPIHPHGTVRVETVDDTRLAALLGSPGAVAVRAALLAAGLDPLEAAARDLRAAGSPAATDARVRVALAAFTAHAARFPTGPADGHHTFLSHVEEFLHLHDADGGIRRRFDAQWRRHGDRVTADVRRVLADGPRDDTGRAWAAWADTAWRLCPPAHDRGELAGAPDREYRVRAAAVDVAPRWDPAVRTYSEYHRRLRHVDYRTGRERAVTCYRFATNVLYRLLPVCDVTPLERLLAAHLFAEAAQRIGGRSWREHLPAAR